MDRLPILILVAASALAQPANVRPSYEAASVKLNESGSTSSSSNGSKGQIVITNNSLHRLVQRAYNVKPYQVIAPEWTNNVRVNIVAKYPPDTTNADRIAMMRTLLEDRFRLAAHQETREMPGYVLVVAKGGFKLKPVEAGGSSTNSNGRGRINDFTGSKVSMDQLAAYVAAEMDQVVIDKTGLSGVYDFELHWTRDDQTPASTDGSAANPLPTLPIALEEVLGVRLQAQKVPVGVIVVDHLERTPTEN
ncbi:MAG TPA: TIGR03435 family protein [Verrucomicrobiae bacterium]|nr:TIGR03435 family protein [Verrucomicrobiae bacterium]